MFESFVNSERCKTNISLATIAATFESFVNSERCKTSLQIQTNHCQFESFVNSERCKTIKSGRFNEGSLRALLIQKDVKRSRQRRTSWKGMEHLYPGLPLMGKILLEQAECHL